MQVPFLAISNFRWDHSSPLWCEKISLYLPRSPTATPHLSSANCSCHTVKIPRISGSSYSFDKTPEGINVREERFLVVNGRNPSWMDRGSSVTLPLQAGNSNGRCCPSGYSVPFYSCVSLEPQSTGWCSPHSTVSLPSPANHLWGTWPTYPKLCLLDDSKSSQVCNGEEPSQYRIFAFCLVIASEF